MMQKLVVIARSLIVLAALWAVLASLTIFFTLFTIETITATAVSGGPERVETAVQSQSWYQAQGLWGSIVLLIFAGLYLLALYLAWRSAMTAIIIISLVALTLSFLAGFSIGLFYLPAAVALLAGTLLLVACGKRTRRV